MNFKRLQGLMLVTLLILVFGSFAPVFADISSQRQGGKVTIDTDNLHIEITGNQNTPTYSFRPTDAGQGVRYTVSFTQMFEFIDDGDGLYSSQDDSKDANTQLSLSSLNVELTDPIEDGDRVDFDFVLTPSESTKVNFTSITFSNHVVGGEAQSLKFDVLINGYEFSNDDINTMLALGFKLLSTSSNSTSDGGSNSVGFGDDGFFEIEPTAIADGGDIDVGLNAVSQGQSPVAFISYQMFSGDLNHDPTIGIQASAGDDNAPISIIMTFVAMLVLVPLVNKGRRN